MDLAFWRVHEINSIYVTIEGSYEKLPAMDSSRTIFQVGTQSSSIF